MKVTLSFDTEVWCGGWDHLDDRFPAAFERYVVGRSRHGDYALPETLAILRRHGLQAVFFVEPLFSARFGRQHLATIVKLIEDAGQEVQLHLHPEWADETTPPLLGRVEPKRPYLSRYALADQQRLIGIGRQLLDAECARPVSAFRAGSYAANRDTFEALSRNGIRIDSSLNRVAVASGEGVAQPDGYPSRFAVGDVQSFPVTVFRDGFGRARPAQVGACSFGELRDALLSAMAAGCEHFVIVSHNFELLKPEGSEPDRIVVRRFERLCAFLAAERGCFEVGGYPTVAQGAAPEAAQPQASVGATLGRHAEQLLRRLA